MKGFLGDEKVGAMISEMDVCPKKVTEPLFNVKCEVLLIHRIRHLLFTLNGEKKNLTSCKSAVLATLSALNLQRNIPLFVGRCRTK